MRPQHCVALFAGHGALDAAFEMVSVTGIASCIISFPLDIKGVRNDAQLVRSMPDEECPPRKSAPAGYSPQLACRHARQRLQFVRLQKLYPHLVSEDGDNTVRKLLATPC